MMQKIKKVLSKGYNFCSSTTVSRVKELAWEIRKLFKEKEQGTK